MIWVCHIWRQKGWRVFWWNYLVIERVPTRHADSQIKKQKGTGNAVLVDSVISQGKCWRCRGEWGSQWQIFGTSVRIHIAHQTSFSWSKIFVLLRKRFFCCDKASKSQLLSFLINSLSHGWDKLQKRIGPVTLAGCLFVFFMCKSFLVLCELWLPLNIKKLVLILPS